MEARITVDEQGRKTVTSPCLEPCPIERGMRILGGKWKGSILWHLREGPIRFNDLARQMGGASKKMVAQRLKELEEQGLVDRTVVNTKPVAVEYAITPLGLSALGFLKAVKEWTEEHGF